MLHMPYLKHTMCLMSRFEAALSYVFMNSLTFMRDVWQGRGKTTYVMLTCASGA